jgi:hypothetical protein
MLRGTQWFHVEETPVGRKSKLGAGLVAMVVAAVAGASMAADMGYVKVVKGTVTIERGGHAIPVAVGAPVQAGDVVRTTANASVGITLVDDTLLSAGPNSVLTLHTLDYDPSLRNGRFDATLGAGTLAVVSGRIAKQSPEAMTLRTPLAILGVRGTEFAVSAHAPVLAKP